MESHFFNKWWLENFACVRVAFLWLFLLFFLLLLLLLLFKTTMFVLNGRRMYSEIERKRVSPLVKPEIFVNCVIVSDL